MQDDESDNTQPQMYTIDMRKKALQIYIVRNWIKST